MAQGPKAGRVKPRTLKLRKVLMDDSAERDAKFAKLTDDAEREVFTVLESAARVLTATEYQFNAVTVDFGQLLLGTAALIQQARADARGVVTP